MPSSRIPVLASHLVRIVFLSGLTFLVSMLLLKFSHSVPTFGKRCPRGFLCESEANLDRLPVAAYVFYALSQVRVPVADGAGCVR